MAMNDLDQIIHALEKSRHAWRRTAWDFVDAQLIEQAKTLDRMFAFGATLKKIGVNNHRLFLKYWKSHWQPN